MSLVNLKTILSGTVEGHYAVGGYVGMDLLSVETVIAAAEATNTPVILLCAQTLFKDEDRAKIYFAATNAMMEAARVPVSMILDHGNSFEAAMRAIGYGFKSVMFDGSSLPIEENIRITRKIVEAAHSADVSVEAEIGHVGGLEGKISAEGSVADPAMYTIPKDAKRFAEETGVDALAVAIGSVHGIYKGTPKIDIDRLDEIRLLLPDLPLVLHGGSGIPDEEFRKAVEHGICKVNIATAMIRAAASKMKECIDEKKNMTTFFDLKAAGAMEMEQVVRHHISVFGTKSLTIK